MSDEEKERIGASFFGVIHRIETKRDGSGRLHIDFGSEAIDEIHWAERLALRKGCGFQVALVPLKQGVGGEHEPEDDFE